jgi:dihydroflavonol-4-reductase
MVFLTGATGFIGSWTLKELLSNGYKVRISLRENSNTKNIKSFLDKVEVLFGDLKDENFVRECLKGCEYVIHTAGKVDTSLIKEKQAEIMTANYISTQNLFKQAIRSRVKKIVFLGSIFGLGKGKDKNLADETVQFNLEHLEKKIPYVRAKRMSEIIADEYIRAGLKCVRVYPNFCLGEGDIYLSSSKAILPFVMGMNFYFDMGINIQWVGDAAKALVLALEKGKEGEKYIVGGENIHYEKIGKIVCERLGKPSPKTKVSPKIFKIFLFTPQKILELIEKKILKNVKLDVGTLLIASEKYWYYSDNKARNELGYSSRSVEETLYEAVDWITEQMNKRVKKKGNPKN